LSISIHQLTKTYGNQIAVDNISFSVGKGEIVGFLGPNGAGKSTTMKIATCFIPPTTGTIEVCGFDVVNNASEVRKKIGYLPEHNPLYLDMYVAEYLAFSGSLYGLSGSALNKNIAEIIEKTGLTAERKKKVGQLSKGYRQRVGLAAALLHQPEVLILDEPTTGLDPNQIVEIRKLIQEVGKDKTVILSTHIMQEVQILCNRVVIIDKGKIVANNQVENLAYNQSQKQFKILVQFKEAIDEALFEAIADLNQVKNLSEGKYELTSHVRDLRSDIFSLCSQKQLPLLEIKLEETNLEQVFQQLTQK
jgi:ABC-2 type transport system ATP-binding protein